jgi:hypothetical protein
LWVELPKPWLEARIAREIPRVLARGEEDVGTPGTVRYEVRRGAVSTALAGDELLVRLGIEADVSVCKPLGFVCVIYGRCAPRVAVEARQSLLVSERYAITPGRVRASVLSGCKVLGYDATPEVVERAEAAAAEAERELTRGLPDLSAQAARAWPLLKRPFHRTSSGCARAQRVELVQVSPNLDHDTFVLGMELRADFVVETPCAEAPDTQAEPPPLTTVTRAPGPGSFVVSELISWTTLEVVLTRGFAEAGRSVRSVTARSSVSGSQRRVRVALETNGNCGAVVLEAEPVVRGARLVFLGVRGLGGAPPRELGEWARALEKLDGPSSIAGQNAQDAALAAAQERQQAVPPELSVELRAGASSVEAEVVREGVALHTQRSLDLRFTPKRTP